MKTKLQTILFMISLFFAVGLFWGFCFFGIFGAAFEYSWTLFGYSMLGGLAFTVLFFGALSLVMKMGKLSEKHKDRRTQNTLEKACEPFMQDGVFTIDGKHCRFIKTKTVVWYCRLFVYNDCFKLIYAYGKKTEMLDIPFEAISIARARKHYFSIKKRKNDGIYISIQDEEMRLFSVLKEKNLPFLCEKMLLTYQERKGDAYFEFQYRRKDYEPNEEVQKNSLFLYWDDEEAFWEIYEPYFNAMNVLTGKEEPFDFYSENAASKKQAKVLREELLKHHPEEYEIFAEWLEKAYTELNGFYISGMYQPHHI